MKLPSKDTVLLLALILALILILFGAYYLGELDRFGLRP